MKTLSVQISVMDESDKELYYYSDFSFIIMQVARELKFFGKPIVDLTDVFGTEEFKTEQLNSIIDAYGDGCLIVMGVEISPMEFRPDEMLKKENPMDYISDILDRDSKIVEAVGMVTCKCPVDITVIPYIYPNEIGTKVIEFLKTTHENLLFKEDDE